MLDREDIIGIVQQTVADVVGIDKADATLDSYLQDDLGLEADDFEDVVAGLQSAVDTHVAPDEVFPEDSPDQVTIHSVVDALERKLGTAT